MPASAEALFGELAEELAPQGAKRGQMFGMACLKDPNGKAFVGLHGEELVVRLNRDTPEHAAALALPGSHLFDPMGGRPMKDWICLALAQHEQWLPLTEAARHMPR
ncbi:hypothetical protein ABH931_003816 [Streptacidiphilus sp. MAP12-33]|uniref:hypothetical protein n=1 Tax=Streptacidiphilus sp. MAP12-33 TaxID=3156266 RepID=UPI003517D382